MAIRVSFRHPFVAWVMPGTLAGEVFECLRREGPLPITRAVDIAVHSCRGLAAAHVLGITHRDVKPENLLLRKHSDGSDLVKVLAGPSRGRRVRANLALPDGVLALTAVG